jgi:molybdenum cofactor sulfurtransferase
MNRYRQITFLDWATSGLFVDSQIDHWTSLLTSGLYGNTHSESPSSAKSSEVVDDLRNDILKFLGTDPLKYSVVFAYSESQALKTFVEAFPFDSSSEFLVSSSSGSNILGLRAIARSKRANVSVFDLNKVGKSSRFSVNSSNLIAFPLVDAFDGTVVTDEQIREILALNSGVVADASHYLAFRRINLSEWPLSAVAFGCDKVFGFPKLGVVVIHNDFIPKLRKPYFGGGTLIYALPDRNVERFRMRPSERFEDGSLPFLTLAAVQAGFALRSQLGDSNITMHIQNMTKLLVAMMRNLTNPDGSRAVTVYGSPTSMVGFNFVNSHGVPKNYSVLLASALMHNITISGGCHSTPGTCYRALGIENPSLATPNIEAVGALRISPGWATTERDILTAIEWMKFATTLEVG